MLTSEHSVMCMLHMKQYIMHIPDPPCMRCVCIFQVMVNVQMLAELEEVIQFKLIPERREVIREMWWNRLRVFWFL